MIQPTASFLAESVNQNNLDSPMHNASSEQIDAKQTKDDSNVTDGIGVDCKKDLDDFLETEHNYETDPNVDTQSDDSIELNTNREHFRQNLDTKVNAANSTTHTVHFLEKKSQHSKSIFNSNPNDSISNETFIDTVSNYYL